MAVKMVRRLSNLTTLRGSPPTSPGLAANFMNYRFNHSSQRSVRPTKLGCAEGWTTPNASGTSETRGVGEALGGGGMVGPKNDPGATEV